MKNFFIWMAFGTFFGGAPFAQASNPRLMGYANLEYRAAHADRGLAGHFNIQALSVLIQHDDENFKFFSEIEYSGVRGAPALSDENGNGATAGGGNETGEIGVERVWVQTSIHPSLFLKFGKELTPTLWNLNHYPHLTAPITRPFAVTGEISLLFHSSWTGAQAFGELPSSFFYNAWIGNSPPAKTPTGYDSGPIPPSSGIRFGSHRNFENGEWEVSGFIADNRDSPGAPNRSAANPRALDLNVSFNGWTIWGEYAAAPARLETSYFVLSYSHQLSRDRELLPFFMWDFLREIGPDDFGNPPRSEPLSRISLGLDYKPTPTIVWKSEILRTFANNGKSEETGAHMALAYFFE